MNNRLIAPQSVRHQTLYRWWLLFITVVLAACQPKPPASPPTLTPNVEIVTLTPRPTRPPNLGGAVDHTAGSDNAYLTIIFYGDFTCAPCVDVARSLLVLRQRYAGDVREIFRSFPQSTKEDDKAMLAAQAAEAASDQGRFWEMHDLLYAQQATWTTLPPSAFRQKLTDYARQIGVADLVTFDQTLDSGRYKTLLEAARQEAQLQGLKGVPALVFNTQRINNVPYRGRIDEYSLDGYVRQRLLEKRWFDKQPALQIDLNKHYTATLVTEKGDIVIELLVDKAPVAVNNFVYLARQGWYDNITWHLVIPDFLAQTGDPSGTGYGFTGYNIADEMDNGLTFDAPGKVVMAHALQSDAPHNTSSQFFITLAALEPRDLYDGRYTIFGQVTQGMDVVRKLTARDPFTDANPPPGDKLITIRIKEQ
ncbi:MAG: peptidylprolyl isomerase [Anaerolineae bacterium]|nr:peptidylprolyl isomerase [Anaerolineae bacterium]